MPSENAMEIRYYLSAECKRIWYIMERLDLEGFCNTADTECNKFMKRFPVWGQAQINTIHKQQAKTFEMERQWNVKFMTVIQVLFSKDFQQLVNDSCDKPISKINRYTLDCSGSEYN